MKLHIYTNTVGNVFSQALPRQLARRPSGKPQVQGGRGQGRVEGRLPAVVQRSQVPTPEHRQITQGGCGLDPQMFLNLNTLFNYP